MIIVSFFQIDGHCLDIREWLMISVIGIASKSENSVTRSGKISPSIMDLGFLKALILAAT